MDASEPIQDVKIEESADSDAELEAVLVVEDDVKAEEASDVPSLPANPLASSATASTSTPVVASPFKLPPNPTIPQDLSIIMDMVANDEVVGSLPVVSMSAAEKRKLVEASLAKNRDKGKEKEKEPQQEELIDQGQQEEPRRSPPEGTGLSDESSSEFESSSEEESDSEDDDANQAEKKPIDDKPMTNEEHNILKQELDEFVNRGDAGGAEVEMDSDAEAEGSDSDLDSDDEGDLSYPNLGAMGFEFMEDDEDEVGPSGGAAITSTHEAPLPPVALPPVERLPQGEGVSLAGDVVSWMREKKVELWLEKKAQEPQLAAKPQGEADAAIKVEQNGSEEAKTEADTTGDAVTAGGEVEKDGGVIAEIKPAVAASPTAKKQADPKFTSSGTVVVRAMQSRPGAADEGWLEEGSVLCWEDGRVLGTVHETFGPLTAPFYTIRLPPPPFPYPTPDQLTPGTRLFYPLNASYRSFVNMLALRDPRLKGSDASNLYDEEIGEDEVEWSDDEAEAEAKKRRKQRRAGSKTPSLAAGNNNNKGKDPIRGGLAGSTSGYGHGHGLPARPHFDYQPTDETAFSETGSMYGGDGDDEGDRWENMSVSASDVDSTASTRGRPKPAPYDLDVDASASIGVAADASSSLDSGGGRGKGRGRGSRGGGRGQGRDRGSGRGRGAGRGRGGNTQSGGRSDQNVGSLPTFPLPSNPLAMGMGMGNPLPMNPMLYQNQSHHQYHQNFAQSPQSSPMHGYSQQNQQQPFTPFPLQQQQFYSQPNYNSQQQPFQGYPQTQGQQIGHNLSSAYNANNDTYEPNQPSTGMPSPSVPVSGQHPHQHQQGYTLGHNHQADTGSGGGVPAINPRFAAQYQQMMNMNMGVGVGMGMGMGMSMGQNRQQWPGPNQSQNQTQNQNPYSQ
ncbi:hypothetical protein I316_00948 [Kwoniella heveanensis BCC8398]|uniref:H/ACA ribonucleoprotein complex non-core subunit NAF1 n=1 Tax=Kwoniella heveanensis BCC8398 TaxID=1296120 RepID=A0A1B9H1C2_9TREE|nr:hypothetical protein I316_00948 [Kwoniella heveanensis BCC8398]